MRTIDLLYQAYVDERMESAESGEEQEAIRQFRNICSKADNSRCRNGHGKSDLPVVLFYQQNANRRNRRNRRCFYYYLHQS